MEFGKFELDEVAEVEGIWKELGGGARIKVARSMNPKFREVFRKKSEPYIEAINARVLDEETSQRLLIETMAETILLTWEGFTEDGKEVEPTVQEKTRILTKYKAFRELVSSISDDREKFKVESVKKTLGNSQPESVGTSTTPKT